MAAKYHILKLIPLLFAAAGATACFGTSGGNRNSGGDTASAEASAGDFPLRYTYRIKAVYPHSTDSYTQGLYWHDGYLWEGTGQYRQSALLQVDLQTGEALRRVDLDPGYFGEGIALLGGLIYQLTWLEGTGLVYDGSSLEQVDTFEYSGQGWGLTTDGQYLYMSNGTHEIAVLEPGTMRKVRTVRVSLDKRRLSQINELEWIDGRIWANVYGTDQIAVIDPVGGVVEWLVDLTGILPAEDRTPRTDVLNGIAYDSERGRIFVTGKYWPKLFEIEPVRK
ncbi:MAG: glutaminyl-peptide cyclotransferase [Rikenellaceae bacterium]|nr:glutaminyl-peptide cyclotransferase [Rikenellaceae bacterium]